MDELRLDRLMFVFEQFDSSLGTSIVVVEPLLSMPGPLTHTPVVDVPIFFIRNVIDELSGMLNGVVDATESDAARSHEFMLADLAVTLVETSRRSDDDDASKSCLNVSLTRFYDYICRLVMYLVVVRSNSVRLVVFGL